MGWCVGRWEVTCGEYIIHQRYKHTLTVREWWGIGVLGKIGASNGWHWKDYKGWGKNGCYIWQETCNKVGSFWRNRTPPSPSLGPGVCLALRAILCNGHIHTTHSSSSAVYTAPINFQLRETVSYCTMKW